MPTEITDEDRKAANKSAVSRYWDTENTEPEELKQDLECGSADFLLGIEYERARVAALNPWVPVKERLPEHGKVVEVTIKIEDWKKRVVYEMHRVLTQWRFADGQVLFNNEEPIAWREIVEPEPFQGGV